MIAVKLKGRLGNQLFQFAFVYSIAKTLDTNFYVDAGQERAVIFEYFELKKNLISNFETKILSIGGFKNFFSFHLRHFFFNRLQRFYQLDEYVVESETLNTDIVKSPKNKTLYNGFFQSEYYFASYENAVKNLFRIKSIYVNQFKAVANSLKTNGNWAVVHIRRGDYLELGWNLPTSYYHQVIEKIHQPNLTYIFISDDPNFVAQEFGYIAQKYISRESEIIDLQFLMNADSCVLSNSSFSWWGAYLNSKAEKKIYVPAFFLGWKNKKEYPAAIIPKDWIKIEIN